MFAGIDNSIRYMVNSGVVTDTITDDFTLLNADAEGAFRMTLSGEDLAVTYADGKWSSFGLLLFRQIQTQVFYIRSL